ncbi:MAG: quinone-dependent dihydroorotate dehydrogenase [Anaerolineae bacterium]|nr:quinone-dependent dihydroorotate dehydrogenase [Gloeobacterales cyanobacterium ES-bin-313]
MDIYRDLARPLIFRFTDPEAAHAWSLHTLGKIAEGSLAKSLDPIFKYTHPLLQTKLWGLDFANPLGVAAGFDKNAEAVLAWEHLGFGLTEVGTVTRHAQPGNPQPRLFRLPEDKAVINRMGFNNDGADKLLEQLKDRKTGIPLGINLGKSKITPLEEASVDYLYSFQKLYDFGDYFVVNVSSPNTPGLRELQQSDRLAEILAVLSEANPIQKPLLIKIAPDLSWEAIDDVLLLCERFKLAGIIATNTTIARDGLKTSMNETGGLSGKPLRLRSTEVIAHIYKTTQGRLPIVGVGGIFSGEDAWDKIIHGASLLQTYTGWIYEGPWIVSRILKFLVSKLEQEGFKNLQEAVGSGVSS